MKHLAQRIVLGLAFIAQAAFGGAPARAQLFVPPPEKILPALDLGSAAPVAAATPAPVKSATITSTAATLDPKKRDPLPPILEAPSVIATRGPATVRTRIGFLKEVVVPGAEVVALLILESDQIVGDVEVSVVLPAGLIYSAPDTKAMRFDAATRTLTWSGLSADRRASFHPFGLKVAPGTNGVLLPLRPFGQDTPNRRIVGSASTLRVGGRVQAKQIDLRGGALAAADGRTHLEFPPGSVDAETVFTITEAAADADAGQSILLRRNEADDEAGAGAASEADTLIQFDISPSMQFSDPVTVTVALDGLLTPEMLVGGTRIPVLRYLSERVITATEGITDGLVATATMVVAEEMPADYDPNTGLLVAHLAHFSAWEVALSDVQTPKTWKLLPQSGSVNAFRGSSSYGYPIPAPGMADGLQPNLSLQYSSAAADRDAQDEANLGVGWSMDLARVYQSVKSEGTWNSNSNQTVYATWETYADGTRVFHPAYYYSAPNNIGDCWSESGCSGLTIWYWVSIATLTAQNDYRLSMNGQEHYLVPLAGEFGEYVFEDYSPVRVFKCQGGQTCGGQPAVAGVPSANSYWQVWTADGTRYVFGSDGVDAERRFWANSTTVVQSWYLRRVYAAHRDSTTAPITYSAEYTYTRPGWDCSGGCVDKPLRLDRVVYGNTLQPNQQRSDVYTLTLAYADNGSGALRPVYITATVGITLAGRTAITYTGSREPMTLTQEAWDATGALKSLPPVTLEYVNGKYLSAVNTGYGGRQEFTYMTSTVGAGNPRLVSELRVLDNTGVGGATNWKSVTTYAYAGGCASTVNAACRAGHDDNNPSGILMGFASVIETAWTDAANTAAVNASSFYVDTPRLGRVRERRVLDGDNRTLQLTRNEYDVSGGRDGAELPPASRLVVLTRTTTWDGDETAGTYRRIDYDFYGTGRPAMVNLYRGWRGDPHNRHWIAGYPLSTREYTWTLLAAPLSGTVPVYSCWFPSPNALFPSAYENCEGQTKNGLVGYAWLTQPTGTVPLDRCASANGDHLIPLSSSECVPAGFTVETNPSPHQGYGYPPTRGGASSASGQPAANEPAVNAFDRSVNTKWVTTFTAGSTWLAYDFGGETVYTPTTYRIASANDGQSRDPKSWNLQGSNDGVTWTGVDTRTNQAFQYRYSYASYTIAAPVGFKRFRLLFQENNGSTETFFGGTGLIQLSEFDLGDAPVYAPDPLLGQPKEIREYASTGLIRRTNVEYATGAPFVIRETRKKVTDASTGARLSENINYYDGQAFGQVGSKGDLSVSRAIATVDGVDQAFDMEIETDAYGNAIFARAYTTYSLASAVPGPSWSATRSNLTQRVLYDPRFHQFVISATNTLGHTTLYEYYGVTEAVNTAGQPFGALKQITDPNGAVTAYSYDAFGRLRKTAAPGDTLSAPSEEIQYFDGVDTKKTDRWPLLITRIARSAVGGAWSPANTATWSRAFYDGLGREIQSMTPAGQGWAQASCNDVPPKTLGNEIIQSSLYDALGRSAVQSVPYTQSQYVYCAPGGPVTTPYVAVPQTAVTQTQPVLSGTGLAAAYYTGKDFNTLALLRTDATVDFDWGNGSPDSRVGVDLFSARWTGTVRANTTENYTFYATGDDGIRLWVNGQLLVDKWQDQGSTEYSAVVPMQAGVPANLVFEYYENGGGAVARLMWSSPTISKQVIPATALYVPRSSLTATLTITPNVPFAKASYDALGRPVQSVDPDGTVQTTMYGSGSTVSTDANRHFKFAAKDGLGRLQAVDDEYVNFSDAFDTSSTANFSTTGSAVALGGAMTLTGTGGLSATLARAGTISDGQGVFIDFWVDQATATQSIALARGVTNTSGYRRWGLALEGGKMCLDTYEGTTRANSCATGSMLALKANTWYRAILRLGQGSMNFMAQVWERDNPAVSKEIRLGMPSGTWQGQGPWDFVAATYSGVLKLDVYDEFVIYRTRYTNDAADRLTKVVDALGNTTTITYDALGRKVGMVDPDMGTWTYAYNPLGQLISQTDALSQTQWFGYDGLGRMTEKRVGGPSGALLASYLYDQGANGIGRRTAMTDTTGYTAWFYDLRGQVTMTQKLIAPNPAAYVTRFGYDDANRVITVSYPGGDVVTNSFDLAGQPYGLYAAGSALVKSAAYNALGAPTRVSFGNGLDKVNQYFGLDVSAGGAWGPLFAYGKLRNTCVITAGTACDSEAPGALLNTVYWYDKAGNVTTVRDNVLNSKLTATYDALDRLVTARTAVYSSTWVETAPLSETYTYNAIGNLTGRFGVGGTGTITYPAAGSARPHAATGAGLNSYVYDANGNMTVRREVSGTETFVYTQTWSVDNRLIGVTKALTSGAVLAQTSYFYDGDGVRVRKDDPDGTTLYAGPVEQTIGPGGTATAEYFDDISGTSTLTAFVATRNETVTAGFQQTFTVPPAGLGNEPWGVRYQIWLTVPTTDTYRLAVYADDGFLLSGQGLSLSNATARDVTTTEASTVLTLTPGAIYNFALTYLNYTSATTGALQLLWRKGSGALEVVPREAIRARGRRDYYSFGGAVVAMKDGVMNAAPRMLSYLHGDHLGSASLTTDISGTVVSQQRYKPYGEVRWSSGAGMPTDKQFTSQTRLVEGYVGTLYDYVARAYDPVLGRFISADTIVPGAGNGQSLNRYAYGLNSPLRTKDPTGHVSCDDCDNRDEAVAANSDAGLERYLNWKAGWAFHVIVEFDYVFNAAPRRGIQGAYGSDLPLGRTFFSIPGAGPSGGDGYPDLWYSSKTGTSIFEIKPDTLAGVTSAQKQLENYVQRCSFCTRADQYPSNTSEPETRNIKVDGLGAFQLGVHMSEPGVLLYKPKIDGKLTAAAVTALVVSLRSAADDLRTPASQQGGQTGGIRVPMPALAANASMAVAAAIPILLVLALVVLL